MPKQSICIPIDSKNDIAIIYYLGGETYITRKLSGTYKTARKVTAEMDKEIRETHFFNKAEISTFFKYAGRWVKMLCEFDDCVACREIHPFYDMFLLPELGIERVK